MMLQSAKNLVKFVSKFNPSDDAVIRLGINHRYQVEAFLELHKGNANNIYFEVMCLPAIETNVRVSDDRSYIDLVGEVDGYKVELTFLKMHSSGIPESDLVDIKKLNTFSNHPLKDIVDGKPYQFFMNDDEWTKFYKTFYSQRQSSSIEKFFNRSKNYDFRDILLGAFSWAETEDGADYWNDISKRTSNV